MTDAVRIFVGCDPNHCDAESQAVLEWSIRKHATAPVEITWMMLSQDPASPFYGWDTRTWATTFSGFRWAVPYLAGYEGLAVYMDSDFIVLSDVVRLVTEEAPWGRYVATGIGGRAWRMCCSVWDCARARDHLPSIGQMRGESAWHGRLNQRFRVEELVQPFAGDWNNLDGRNGKPLSQIDALHYTRMSTQPHLPYAKQRLAAAGRRHWYDGETGPHAREDVQRLFDDLFSEAIDNGFLPSRYTQHEPFGEVLKRSFAGRPA